MKREQPLLSGDEWEPSGALSHQVLLERSRTPLPAVALSGVTVVLRGSCCALWGLGVSSCLFQEMNPALPLQSGLV